MKKCVASIPPDALGVATSFLPLHWVLVGKIQVRFYTKYIEIDVLACFLSLRCILANGPSRSKKCCCFFLDTPGQKIIIIYFSGPGSKLLSI